MSNLLTNQIKKRLRNEYRLRLIIVGLLFFSSVLFIASIFLVPSYFLVDSRKEAAESKAQLFEQGFGREESQEIFNALRLTQAKISLISSVQEGVLFSDLIREIIERKPSGIDIESFFYTSALKEEDTLVLKGEALARNDLLSFERELKGDSDFTSVALPVSDLAQDRNISFSITIKGNF